MLNLNSLYRLRSQLKPGASVSGSVYKARVIMIWTFVSLLSFSNCRVGPTKDLKIEPRGELLAYFKITEVALIGPIKRTTGYYFYVESEENVAGPFLNGYQYQHGKIIQEFGTGSDSAAVIEAIEQIGLEPFDFEKEIMVAEEKSKANPDPNGVWVLSMDGTEWEIMIQTKKGKFLSRIWNPGSEFKNYARYSANIAKLEQVLRILVRYYGEATIGLL